MSAVYIHMFAFYIHEMDMRRIKKFLLLTLHHH